MTRSSIILLSIYLFLPINRSLSQPLDGAQIRRVNQALLEVINDYESYSRFTSDNKRINESYISSFSGLFDDNASLYNDIVPSNKVSEPVSISQYISIFNKYYPSGVGIRLHNILFDAPSYLGNGKYEVNAELSKEIYGYTGTNVSYRDTIPLVLKLGFSISGNEISDIKILGISGERKGRFLKLRVLKFLTLKPIENSLIKIDSRIIRTDFRGIARIDDIDPLKKHNLIISHDSYRPIVYSKIDIDEFIEGNTDRYHHKLKLRYYDQNESIFIMNTLNFTLTPLISFGVPGLKTIVSEGCSSELKFEGLRECGNLSPRFGIRFGIIMLKTRSVDLSLNTGIEKNYIRASYKFDTCRIANLPLVIEDLYNFKQKLTLNFTYLPLLISLDYKKFKDFEINAISGIRFSRLNKSSCSVKSGYAVNGLYEDVDALTADYYNFHSENKFMTYQLGVTISKEIFPSLKIYAGPTIFLYNKNWLENEISSDEILSSDKKLNNILNTYTKSKIQNMTMEFGIKYNFNSINLKKQL